MNIEDKLLMLDVLFDVRVSLAPDGEHIELRGAPAAIECATPKLLQLKPELVEHLRATASSTRTP